MRSHEAEHRRQQSYHRDFEHKEEQAARTAVRDRIHVEATEVKQPAEAKGGPRVQFPDGSSRPNLKIVVETIQEGTEAKVKDAVENIGENPGNLIEASSTAEQFV
jgi:hypothetical protein